MIFSIEWIPDGENASGDERSTLCQLNIIVGDSNVSAFYDLHAREQYDGILVPAVHLAEGMAGDWWSIFGGRDTVHRVVPWRMGFVLPDLRFEYDGSRMVVACDVSRTSSPDRLFWQSSTESLTRQQAERVLADFVDQVVEKLADDGIADAHIAMAWARVCESRADDAERAFCEAAGALGADPYAISNSDSHFIDATGALFEGEALLEFLAGIGASTSRSNRAPLVDWIGSLRPRHRSSLPELTAVAAQLGDWSGVSVPWVRGHRAARAFRAAMGIDGNNAVTIKSVAAQLGGTHFARKKGPRGVFAVVARDGEDVHVHLRDRGRAKWASSAETFAFARAIGDAVCFPDTPRSVINDLHRAERQAVGRAFAAEFLAPVNTVLGMRDDGQDIDEIAGLLGVDRMVVNHQIEDALDIPA